MRLRRSITVLMALIRPSQLQPRPIVTAPHRRRLLQECIVNTLVVNRWRFGSTVCVVVAHDEIPADRRDPSRIRYLVRRDAPKKNPVFQPGDLSRGLLLAFPEHQNHGGALHRTRTAQSCWPGLAKSSRITLCASWTRPSAGSCSPGAEDLGPD